MSERREIIRRNKTWRWTFCSLMLLPAGLLIIASFGFAIFHMYAYAIACVVYYCSIFALYVLEYGRLLTTIRENEGYEAVRKVTESN